MSSPSANFSSLQQARDISTRLASLRQEPAAPDTPPPRASYVAFRPRPASPAAPAVAVPGADALQPEPLPPVPGSVRTWDDMLRWCLEAASAKTVFVMDAQGFVIAKDGSYSYEDAEAMGTQLMVALDRFDELDSFHKRALSISVGFRSFHLTGLRVLAESRDSFTLGILRTDPIAPAAVDAIAELVGSQAARI